MPFDVPNYVDALAAGYPGQARNFAADWRILGQAITGDGLLEGTNGCVVTQRAAGANMSVDVSAGSVVINGSVVAVAGGNEAIAASDDTYDRIDLIMAEDDGSVTVLTGDPAPVPVPLNPTADGVALAMVYVPANDSAIQTAQVRDKRVEVASPIEAPQWNFLELDADVDNSNATPNTMEDVTGLSFAVTSGIRYTWRCQVWYTTDAVGTGTRWGMNGPTFAAGNLVYTNEYSGVDIGAQLGNVQQVAWDLPTGATSSTSVRPGLYVGRGFVLPNANGTVVVRHACENAGPAFVRALRGSWLEWRIVGEA